MDSMPIYQKLLEHDLLNHSSFHTPGHKCQNFFPKNLLNLDYTELPDTDALYEAEGIILQSEILLSKLFQTKRSLISSGGCTLAIQTMLKLASERGNKILFARNSHRSAVNTCVLLGIEPVWLMPSGSGSFTGRVQPEDIQNALSANPEIKACYLTSPSYYGELSDIQKISEICHEHGAILLIDNAHGSHLAFMKNNLHPIFLGADISACSLHKTMPVLTGGAVLNIADNSLVENAKSAMSLFGSTSPSYIIMSSIDICVNYMMNLNGKEEYLACEERVAKIKKLASEKGIIQPARLCDPLRVCLNTASLGLCGKEQEEYFFQHQLDCEFCDGENAVFICTPFNTEEDFQRLENAIIHIPEKKAKKDSCVLPFSLPEAVMTPREAILKKSELVNIDHALGRISADSACPCPPGIPVVMPGEIISEEVIFLLKNYNIKKIKVL